MDELEIVALIRNTCITASVIGVIAGLDLILGAKIIMALKRLVDKAFDADKVIIKLSSAFRKTLDKGVNFDEAVISQAKSRLVLGVIFLGASLLMIALLATSR